MVQTKNAEHTNEKKIESALTDGIVEKRVSGTVHANPKRGNSLTLVFGVGHPYRTWHDQVFSL